MAAESGKPWAGWTKQDEQWIYMNMITAKQGFSLKNSSKVGQESLYISNISCSSGPPPSFQSDVRAILVIQWAWPHSVFVNLAARRWKRIFKTKKWSKAWVHSLQAWRPLRQVVGGSSRGISKQSAFLHACKCTWAGEGSSSLSYLSAVSDRMKRSKEKILPILVSE